MKDTSFPHSAHVREPAWEWGLVRVESGAGCVLSALSILSWDLNSIFQIWATINEFRCYEVKIEESEKVSSCPLSNPGHLWLELPVLCHWATTAGRPPTLTILYIYCTFISSMRQDALSIEATIFSRYMYSIHRLNQPMWHWKRFALWLVGFGLRDPYVVGRDVLCKFNYWSLAVRL